MRWRKNGILWYFRKAGRVGNPNPEGIKQE
jgi:hypothetical protein